MHCNDVSLQYCLIHSSHTTNQHRDYLTLSIRRPYQDLSSNIDAKLQLIYASYIATKQTRKAEYIRHVDYFQPVYLTTNSLIWYSDIRHYNKRISNGVLLRCLCCISILITLHTPSHTLSRNITQPTKRSKLSTKEQGIIPLF